MKKTKRGGGRYYIVSSAFSSFAAPPGRHAVGRTKVNVFVFSFLLKTSLGQSLQKWQCANVLTGGHFTQMLKKFER